MAYKAESCHNPEGRHQKSKGHQDLLPLSLCVCVCVHTFPSFYKYTSYIDLRASLQDGPILTKAALRKGFLNPRPSPTGHNILINAVTALRHELCR